MTGSGAGAPRPLVLDVTSLFGTDPEPVGRAIAANLPGALRLRRRGVELVSAGPPPAGEDTALAPLRAWLLGDAGRSAPAKLRPRLSVASLTPHRRVALPERAALILPGIASWAPPVPALLADRPDVRAIAVLEPPLALDWPEYAAAAAVAALPAAFAAVARHAAIVVVPDATASHRLADALPRQDGRPRIVVAPRPSGLAGTAAPETDAALAAVPYLVACGPIEARANTLLLLHLWRDLVARGGMVPRLVLVGARGAQGEDIRPMLDWNETLRPVVAEAPGLSRAALRALLVHARALLAPDFAGHDEALLRDARACGVPVIAARRSPGELDPIDGRGWRETVLAAAARPPRGPMPAPVLPDWPDYVARIVAHAEAF